jgi:tRNA-specific 2-thiouridylase
MGICFVGKKQSFGEFLGQYFPLSGGYFIDYDTGLVVGRHDGKESYTGIHIGYDVINYSLI